MAKLGVVVEIVAQEGSTHMQGIMLRRGSRACGISIHEIKDGVNVEQRLRDLLKEVDRCAKCRKNPGTQYQLLFESPSFPIHEPPQWAGFLCDDCRDEVQEKLDAMLPSYR